jgi:hypothetical protein
MTNCPSAVCHFVPELRTLHSAFRIPHSFRPIWYFACSLEIFHGLQRTTTNYNGLLKKILFTPLKPKNPHEITYHVSRFRLTEFVASLTKIDANPHQASRFVAADLSRRSSAKAEAQRRRNASRFTNHVSRLLTGNLLGEVITHLNAILTDIYACLTKFNGLFNARNSKINTH